VSSETPDLVVDLPAVLAAHQNGQGELPPLNGLVAELVAALRDYLVMTDEQYLVVALWIIHTYLVDRVEQTPYLAVTSPEKHCGKTRLLEVLQLLVNVPWFCTLPSESVFYRKIDKVQPTVLLDETDAIFSPKTAPLYEGLRAAINAGTRRGVTVDRCIAGGAGFESFSVYCPKVLAGIGSLPDTIADRSIPIRLARKTRDETVKRFRLRDVKPELQPIALKVVAWANEHAEAVAEARPELPDGLDDRMQDACEVLVAIADLLGCGEHARRALVTLHQSERVDSHESYRLQLLEDLYEIFGRDCWAEEAGLHTTQVLMELHNLAESGWKTYFNKRNGLDAHDLAALLREYGIKSRNVRSKSMGTVAKGYRREQFADAWSRYL
jgi:hypothetical protein